MTLRDKWERGLTYVRQRWAPDRYDCAYGIDTGTCQGRGFCRVQTWCAVTEVLAPPPEPCRCRPIRNLKQEEKTDMMIKILEEYVEGRDPLRILPMLNYSKVSKSNNLIYKPEKL